MLPARNEMKNFAHLSVNSGHNSKTTVKMRTCLFIANPCVQNFSSGLGALTLAQVVNRTYNLRQGSILINCKATITIFQRDSEVDIMTSTERKILSSSRSSYQLGCGSFGRDHVDNFQVWEVCSWHAKFGKELFPALCREYREGKHGDS